MTHSFIVSTSQKKLASFDRNAKIDASVSKGTAAMRDLMGAAVENTLINAYPMTYRLLETHVWKELVSSFFTSYQPQSTFSWQLPKALLDFVVKENWNRHVNIPYLSELMDFEWLEIEVYMLPDVEKASYNTQGDLMQDILYVNPEHRLKQYSYPVFLPAAMPRDTETGEYHLFCFRHPKTRQIHWLSFSRFYRYVIESLIQGETTGKEAIHRAAQKCSIPVDPRLYEEGRSFLQDLFSQEAILGFL